MFNRQTKIAAAALLLLLSQEDDFDDLLDGDEELEEPPPKRQEESSRHVKPSREQPPAPTESRHESVDNEVSSVVVEVGEPIELADAPNPEPDVANQTTAPLYIPPPSKRNRKMKRASTEALGESSDQKKKKKKKLNKSFWSQKLYLQREYPPDDLLSQGMPHMDPSEELKALRMSEASFEKLCSMVSPFIKKKATLMRAPISPRHKMVAALRFLVSGQTLDTLKFKTLLSPAVMSSFLPEVFQALVKVLSPTYMKHPESKEDWQNIAGEFAEKCDFPNCGGSLNARHVIILKTGESKHHTNHHGYCSVVLSTLVDANHRFVHAEVISKLRDSDQAAISSSEFFQKLSTNSLDLPDNSDTVGNRDFVFTAPDSFPPHSRLLTMFPAQDVNDDRQAYNDKVLSVDRYSENSLGLIASRFGILRTAITLRMWKIEWIVKACCVLHNYLSIENGPEYASSTTYDRLDNEGNLILGDWRANSASAYRPLQSVSGYQITAVNSTRELYREYFRAQQLK